MVNKQPTESKSSALRRMLHSKDLEYVLEAHSGISAKIIEETGFKGIWASGLAISAGGAGKVEVFPPVILKGKASAIAAASIYHYTKYTPNMVKGIMNRAGIPVRMYPDVDYSIT